MAAQLQPGLVAVADGARVRQVLQIPHLQQVGMGCWTWCVTASTSKMTRSSGTFGDASTSGSTPAAAVADGRSEGAQAFR